MVDWLTWWFAYVYGAVKKVGGASTTVWQAIAADAAAELYAACGSNKQTAIDTLERWELNNTEHVTYNQYIEDWINAQ